MIPAFGSLSAVESITKHEIESIGLTKERVMKKYIIYCLLAISSYSNTYTIDSCSPAIGCQPCGDCSTDCSQSCDCCELDCCHTSTCKTYLAHRSQGSDTARWMMGFKAFIAMMDNPDETTAVMITPGFSRSFRDQELAPFFLPKCDSNCLIFDRDSTDANVLRPDDFGLSGTGTVCICPQLSNFFIDFGAYFDLKSCCEGLFFEVHAPVVHTWWDANCTACQPVGACSAKFPPCLMASLKDDGGDLVSTLVGTTDLKKALRGNFTWPAVENELCFGIICKDRIAKTRLAEVRVGLGYYAYKCDWWGIGVKVVGAIPAGNVPEAHFMLDPVVGNGGHGELGGGLMAHATCYECEDGSYFAWYLDGYATHMFTSRTQRRLFDLTTNGCFSRYLLLKEFDPSIATREQSLIALERGPNVFAQPIKVAIDVQGDVSTMFSYIGKCFSFDIGYNFWGRSREKCKEFGCCIPENVYGIKGTLPFCEPDGAGDIGTASRSTINTSSGTEGEDDGIDPRFVACKDLDLCSALNPSVFTHSVFANLGYSNERVDCDTFFGVGGKIEFTDNCHQTVQQWQVWATGAVSF